jgi:hypothetical protein
MEIDPDAAAVRCQICRVETEVWSVEFICSCGRRFDTSDVAAAIKDILATAQLFAIIVARDRAAAGRARAAGETSFQRWIGGIAEGIGGHLGGLLGSIAGSIARWLFG